MTLVLDLASLPDSLFAILQGYASLTSIRSLPDISNASFFDAHDFLLNWLLLNPHFQVYPPSEQYQVSFWKWAIGKLENLLANQDAAIDDRLYTHLVELVQGSSSATVGVRPPKETYVTYIWHSPGVQSPLICAGLASATLLESRTLIERGTTGLTTWKASIALAELLIRHPELVQDRRVLELGCGAGFLGIVVATLQQQRSASLADDARCRPALWLTDVDSNVLRRCQDNVRLPCNASSNHAAVHCAEIDWTDATNPSTRPSLEARLGDADADVIIGADIVFDPGIIPALVRTLSLAFISKKIPASRETIAYIALTIRNADTHSQFVNEAEHHLDVQDISMQLGEGCTFGVQHGAEQVVKLYRLKERK